ncbi:pro-adrenomedullin-like isoform X2 [Heptranchias perlo]|uniref:pro-adrenomedullin-like isoform X2 n=1 Tax=Heptranchias perlo TaxID=212740 RepID=UPI00355AB624
MMVSLILLAVFYLHTGAVCESQELASTNRTPHPSPALLLYLQKLKNSKTKVFDRHVQSVLESYTGSASEFLYVKSEDTKESISDSTVPHGRVKRHKLGSGYHPSRHSSWGCPLATCQTHNLANWLYLLAVNKGKDDTAPKNTGDPHSYGKRRRRRRSIYLPGNSIRLHTDVQTHQQGRTGKDPWARPARPTQL